MAASDRRSPVGARIVGRSSASRRVSRRDTEIAERGAAPKSSNGARARARTRLREIRRFRGSARSPPSRDRRSRSRESRVSAELVRVYERRKSLAGENTRVGRVSISRTRVDSRTSRTLNRRGEKRRRLTANARTHRSAYRYQVTSSARPPREGGRISAPGGATRVEIKDATRLLVGSLFRRTLAGCFGNAIVPLARSPARSFAYRVPSSESRFFATEKK